MTIKFRTPPKMRLPESARWECVFRLPDEIELWLLGLRKASPGYYPVFCRLNNDLPTPLYAVPLTSPELKSDHRVLKNWGDQFFWSKKENVFVVQLKNTFEYSNRLETEQVFFSGDTFEIQKILKNENLMILSKPNFNEVFPEMHPDRDRTKR